MRINDPTHSFNRQFHRMMKLSERTRAPEQSRAPELCFQPELLGVGHEKPGCCLPPPPLSATPSPHPAMQPGVWEGRVRATTESGTRVTDLLPPPQPLQHSIYDHPRGQWSKWTLASKEKFPRINIITLPTIDFPIISWIPPFNISAFPHFSILLFSVSQFCFSSTLLFSISSILLSSHSSILSLTPEEKTVTIRMQDPNHPHLLPPYSQLDPTQLNSFQSFWFYYFQHDKKT